MKKENHYCPRCKFMREFLLVGKANGFSLWSCAICKKLIQTTEDE